MSRKYRWIADLIFQWGLYCVKTWRQFGLSSFQLTVKINNPILQSIACISVLDQQYCVWAVTMTARIKQFQQLEEDPGVTFEPSPIAWTASSSHCLIVIAGDNVHIYHLHVRLIDKWEWHSWGQWYCHLDSMPFKTQGWENQDFYLKRTFWCRPGEQNSACFLKLWRNHFLDLLL